ncbi:MAG: CopG family ribbon-helix-helix protein [Candidatus Diapherotrites archaeon]|uniref:CopG family ribbon-helix-helix protein n=1 Tax=Candidatus Iainarchaeum sp. TaxID=3101447 RepID=A0A8T3YKA1_9ARCH|nr:CopG family ribbon-helix-helix protein [Candidatus Diapherotrites archaeon]
MPIVSVSLDDETLSEADLLQAQLGIKGRSELVRSAIRMMVSDRKDKSLMKGDIDSVMLIIHADRHTPEFSAVRHRHGGIVKMQLHSHLKNHKCLEILVLSGDSGKIKGIYEELQASRKIDYVKLIVP